jgi:hypothetical protein
VKDKREVHDVECDAGKQVRFRATGEFKFSEGVDVEFADHIEVSLGCAQCRKFHRTVVVRRSKSESYCTPTHHPFPASIVEITRRDMPTATEIAYTVEYDYKDFIDVRYGIASKEIPSWGRLYFHLTCPVCKSRQEEGTQNNIVRPWSCYCPCGFLFYTEKEEMPIFEAI